MKTLTYRGWSPRSHTLPDYVANNHYDRAAIAMWKMINKYVKDFAESNKIQFQTLGDSTGELTDGAVIRLKSTESLPNQQNVLGSWVDSHDCYYWVDNFNTKSRAGKSRSAIAV